MASKTGAPLKGVFDTAKAQAAEAVMQPDTQDYSSARNRKAGGRNVRISGYVPSDIDQALRDEMIRRTVESRRAVSFNDVLCSILAEWRERQQVTP